MKPHCEELEARNLLAASVAWDGAAGVITIVADPQGTSAIVAAGDVLWQPGKTTLAGVNVTVGPSNGNGPVETYHFDISPDQVKTVVFQGGAGDDEFGVAWSMAKVTVFAYGNGGFDQLQGGVWWNHMEADQGILLAAGQAGNELSGAAALFLVAPEAGATTIRAGAAARFGDRDPETGLPEFLPRAAIDQVFIDGALADSAMIQALAVQPAVDDPLPAADAGLDQPADDPLADDPIVSGAADFTTTDMPTPNGDAAEPDPFALPPAL